MKRIKHSDYIKKCDDLQRKILKLRNPGLICEVCGKICQDRGVMHLLSKGSNPNMRYHWGNVMYAGWSCCHMVFDQDPKKRKSIEDKIKSKRGDDIFDHLKIMANILPLKIYMPGMLAYLQRVYKNFFDEEIQKIFYNRNNFPHAISY